MKREIKFRARRLYDGEWVYGNLVDDYPCTFIAREASIERNNDACVYLLSGLEEVDPTTVGQFTGIVDKNGVEIWEGDIVLLNNHFEHVINFGGGAFYGHNGIILSQWSEKEVIGTAFDLVN